MIGRRVPRAITGDDGRICRKKKETPANGGFTGVLELSGARAGAAGYRLAVRYREATNWASFCLRRSITISSWILAGTLRYPDNSIVNVP